jgi:phosphohistidine swiveling domain-containing protein
MVARSRSTRRARLRNAAGVPVVLVRQDAEAADVEALGLSVGLPTRRGARTSHAAVVVPQMGKVCLVGCAGSVSTCRGAAFAWAAGDCRRVRPSRSTVVRAGCTRAWWARAASRTTN